MKEQTGILRPEIVEVMLGLTLAKEADKLKSPSRGTKVCIQNLKKALDPRRLLAYRQWSTVVKGPGSEASLPRL